MKHSYFGRLVVIVVAGLVILVVGHELVDQFLEPRLPQLVNLVVGERGPIGLRFAQEMQPQSVENRWAIEPYVIGRFNWDGQLLWFWPGEALKPGALYNVSLQPGSKRVDGRSINQLASWAVQVRQPSVLYLSPPSVGSEVWIASTEGSSKVKLTQTGNHVYDFAPSDDGEWVAYSVANAQNGMDLWRVRRDGQEAQRVLDCGADSCTQPAWSPDGKRLAYNQSQSTALPGVANPPGSRVWTLEIRNGKTSPVDQDSTVGGVAPSWSPDGNHLAFYDPAAKLIHVVDLQGGEGLQLKSQNGELGGWSPDSRYLFFVDQELRDLLPNGVGCKVDVNTKTVERLFGTRANFIDINALAPMAGENWVAVGIRYSGGSRSTQIQLLSPDGASQRDITNDHLFTHGAFSWSPDVSTLVFQKVKIGASTAKPEVWVWEASTGKNLQVAADATLPAWLP